MPVSTSRNRHMVLVFYGIAPNEIPFDLVNRPLGKKALGELIDKCYRVCGAKRTVLCADAMMALGYIMSTSVLYFDARAGVWLLVIDGRFSLLDH